jgi:hypothetical protein
MGNFFPPFFSFFTGVQDGAEKASAGKCAFARVVAFSFSP